MISKVKKDYVIFCVAGYLFANFIPFLIGLGAVHNTYYTPCKESLARIEYAFPGMRIGCYLGDTPQ